MSHRLFVSSECLSEEPLAREIRRYLGIEIETITLVQGFSILKQLNAIELQKIQTHVFGGPFLRVSTCSAKAHWRLEVSLKPGLTDPLGDTAQASIEDCLQVRFLPGEKVQSFKQYLIWSKAPRSEIERIGRELLANPLVEEIHLTAESDSLSSSTPRASEPHKPRVATIPLEGNLMEMSRSRQLSLNLAEMEAIAAYFHRESRAPTDVEIEAIAQTWSEHCKHKIFNARIHYRENGQEEIIDSLFRRFIKQATTDLNCDWLVSVFHDNAGVIRFNERLLVACKVETHNSPSALDPYGGALTGILGVNRDILGTGSGARPIANMDVLCFAPPDYQKQLPERLLHPRRILEGVCKGIEQGGNKSGIPTVNGALFFDESYLGKPLVYCGTVGILTSYEKEGKAGDWIFLVGGKTGRDGIHGATFSSEELHRDSPTSAVQIGDPFTQKKLTDFLLDARARNLFRTLTDNGAGGLSSSVGEMALLSGGCEIHLEKVPLKEAHLHPWEILVSESQERMTLSVPPETAAELLELAAFHEVTAAHIGSFTASGLFHVLYEGKTVASLSLSFLHQGVPQLVLEAEWTPPPIHLPSISSSDLGADLHRLLARYSICSKESIVRRYDHEVQGASCLKPFVGAASDGPSDAAVLALDGEEGLAISCGLCPRYSSIDPYAMALAAVDEALRNQIAVGADPARIAILDNFCWPDPIYDPIKTPDGKYKLAQLVRAAKGLYQAATLFQTPIISGKDSMKNDYKMGGHAISILPTLLITAIGKVPAISKIVSMDFKEVGHRIYLLGETKEELGGSEYYAMQGLLGGAVPLVDPLSARKRFFSLFRAIQEELIASCHDCSEGGLAVALAECAFAGGFGVDADLASLSSLSDLALLFSETPSRFIVSIAPHHQSAFEAIFQGEPFTYIGTVSEARFRIRRGPGHLLLDEDPRSLKQSWQVFA